MEKKPWPQSTVESLSPESPWKQGGGQFGKRGLGNSFSLVSTLLFFMSLCLPSSPSRPLHHTGPCLFCLPPPASKTESKHQNVLCEKFVSWAKFVFQQSSVLKSQPPVLQNVTLFGNRVIQSVKTEYEDHAGVDRTQCSHDIIGWGSLETDTQTQTHRCYVKMEVYEMRLLQAEGT